VARYEVLDEPPLGILGLLDLNNFIRKMNQVADEFPSSEVWNHPQAKKYDNMTVGQYIDTQFSLYMIISASMKMTMKMTNNNQVLDRRIEGCGQACHKDPFLCRTFRNFNAVLDLLHEIGGIVPTPHSNKGWSTGGPLPILFFYFV